MSLGVPGISLDLKMFLLPASLRTPGISLFFAIARTDMRCLDTPCYASACARTVRIMHAWGGG